MTIKKSPKDHGWLILAASWIIIALLINQLLDFTFSLDQNQPYYTVASIEKGAHNTWILLKLNDSTERYCHQHYFEECLNYSIQEFRCDKNNCWTDNKDWIQ